MRHKLRNTIFTIKLILFGLIITGVLPREISLYIGVGLILYFIIVSLEDSAILFVMTIPLFLALPLTETFDNFNTWRILVVILFAKWFFSERISVRLKQFKNWILDIHHKKPSFWFTILLLISALSVLPADDKVAAAKRIIYFVNFAMFGFVVYDLARSNKEFIKHLIRGISVPTIIVTVVGFLQVITTYFIDVYQFMAFWGEGVQCRQFGQEWCSIAVYKGNTWLAYYGEQLSLRVFSLFPDSHSFPQFVLLGLPAVLAISILKLTSNPERYNTLLKMIKTRVSLKIVWVPAIFLIAILSGTRGIWAASLGVIIVLSGVIYWMKKTSADIHHRNLIKYTSLYLAGFFMLFAVAYPIFVSPQFLLSKGDWGLLGNRIKSIIDFGETSNAQRILIWKKTGESIARYPFLGVGIGNYPVVLNQDIKLSRAGSSAHNIYLHVASEMGILALLILLWLLWLLFRKTYVVFIKEKDPLLITYFAGTLMSVTWVLTYSLTDIALFDERTFLLFVTTIALILGNKNPDKRDIKVS